MVATALWGVLLGGALAIAGGVIGPTIVHRLQAKEREHRLRAEKLEQLAASALESQVWLENVRDDKLFRKDIRPGVSPITRAYAIATIYFPELVDKVNELQQAAQSHVQWIAQTALKQVEGQEVEFPPADLNVNYRNYMDKLQDTIAEINRTASRDFRMRNAPLFDPLRRQSKQAIGPIRNRIKKWRDGSLAD
jgi:hypothetical protein